MSFVCGKGSVMEDGKTELIGAINKLSKALERRIQSGKAEYERSGRDITLFCKSSGPDNIHGLLTLYPVQDYAECFRSLGVESKEELEALWSKYFSGEDVRSSVEALISAEEAYNRFIAELDDDCKAYEETIKLPIAEVGNHLQKDTCFIETRSGKEVLLGDILQKSPHTLFVLRKHFV